MKKGKFVARLYRPAQEFAVIFVGDFGEVTAKEFSKLKKVYPILNKCEHVKTNANQHIELVELFDNVINLDVLVSCNMAKFIIFVVDTNNTQDMAITETLANILDGEGLYICCLTPGINKNASEFNFDLIIDTYAHGKEITGHVLTTLHNAYIGCGKYGNLQCLKVYIIEVFKKYRTAAASIARIEKSSHGYDYSRLVEDCISGFGGEAQSIKPAPIFALIETSAVDFTMFEEIYSCINEHQSDETVDMLMHAGLSSKDELKMTMLKFLS